MMHAMETARPFPVSRPLGGALLVLLSACTSVPAPESRPPPAQSPSGAAASARAELLRYHDVNRLTWGASPSALAQSAGRDFKAMLDEQLAPGPALLPATAQAQIDALSLSRQAFTHGFVEADEKSRLLKAADDMIFRRLSSASSTR
jgi:hypothetical protein